MSSRPKRRQRTPCVLACFEAGAVASGCTWSLERAQPRYANLIQEPLMSGVWNNVLAALGRPTIPVQGLTGGSTDRGNVSHVVFSIHPAIAIRGSIAPPHTREFATDARTREAAMAAIAAAIALAWTALDIAVDPEKRSSSYGGKPPAAPGATTVSQDG